MTLAGKFLCRKCITRLFLGGVLLLSAGLSISGMPLPPPMSRDEYLKTQEPFVYTGRFVRLVHISSELDHKLFDRNSTISEDELRLFEHGELSNAGAQFMEIHNARVALVKPDRFKHQYRKDCRFARIYVTVSSAVDFRGADKRAAHYRDLLGKDVVLLAFGRHFYGRQAVDFPGLTFLGAEGMGDHAAPSILPLSELPNLSSAALQWDYVDAQVNLCTKN